MLWLGGVFKPEPDRAVSVADVLWVVYRAGIDIPGARPHLLPELLRRTHVVAVAGELPLILMIFWLVQARSAGAVWTGVPAG